MYTSFSWETEDAFDVAFKFRQHSSRRGDTIGLGMRTPESAHSTLGQPSSRRCDAFPLQIRTPKCVHFGTQLQCLVCLHSYSLFVATATLISYHDN